MVVPNDDLDALLRQLDPIPDDSFAGVGATDGARRLLAEIVADGSADEEELLSAGPRRSLISLLAVGAVLVTVLLAFTFSQLGGQSAAAAVNSAASETAAMTAGRLVVTVELTTLPAHDPTPSGSVLRFDASYDGGNYHVTSDVSALAPAVFSEALVTSHVRVGDREFFRVGTAGWSETTGAWSLADDAGVGAAVDNLARSGDQLSALLSQVDGLSRTEDGNGASLYEGTLQAEVLKATPAEALPIGVSVLREHPLPQLLGIEVVVRNGLLESVTVRAEGLVEGYGYEDVTVRSVFQNADPALRPVVPDGLIPIADATAMEPDLTPAGTVRLRGQVIGEPEQQTDQAIRFALEGGIKPIPVTHVGPPPPGILSRGSEVIVLGEWHDDTFISQQVIIRSTS